MVNGINNLNTEGLVSYATLSLVLKKEALIG
jgi:hypothetical protein